jgi:hypothetical protein
MKGLVASQSPKPYLSFNGDTKFWNYLQTVYWFGYHW